MAINNDNPGGRMFITGRDDVDQVLNRAVEMAQTYTEDSQGDLRPIDDAEYAQLQGMVAELSCSDKDALEHFLPVWTKDHGAAYAVAIDSLRNDRPYGEFLGTLATVQAHMLYVT